VQKLPRASPVATKLRHKIVDLTQDLHAAELARYPMIPDIEVVRRITRIKTDLFVTEKALRTNEASRKRSHENRTRKRTAQLLDGVPPPKMGRPSTAVR